MSGIHEFKAMMDKRGGFARPNLFKVAISKVAVNKQRDYQMRCFQAQIPGHNIATTDKDIGFRSIAYQRIYSDVILGFYVAADLAELEFWQGWIDSIIDKRTNHHKYYDKYKGEIAITQENRSGKDVATWTLHDAYPKQVDPIQLDYGTNDAVMTCNVTLTYRHFTHNKLLIANQKAVEVNDAQPLYAHDVRTDLNKINPMIELRKEGWKFDRKTISQATLLEMYPDWERRSAVERADVLKLYNIEGLSKTGGALHMITTEEEDE